MNDDLNEIDKSIKYLGDNEDLGLNARNVVDNITQVWNPLDAIDNRQAKRAERDKQRVTFFTNINSFLKELQTIYKLFEEKKKKEEVAKKRMAAKKAVLEHSISEELGANKNNTIRHVLDDLNSREGFNHLRESREKNLSNGKFSNLVTRSDSFVCRCKGQNRFTQARSFQKFERSIVEIESSIIHNVNNKNHN